MSSAVRCDWEEESALQGLQASRGGYPGDLQTGDRH